MCDDSGLVGNEASNVEVGEYDTEMRTTKKLADHVLIEWASVSEALLVTVVVVE
jgi:hypothetical protein